MKYPRHLGWYSSLIVLSLSTLPVAAQIAPDNSLPTSVSSGDGINFTIENGARFGNNLFHSFREFSVPTNGSAFFNNATEIQNIFSRVTGGNISQIDGLIRANGGANLFLLNPAGIVFGPNARLNIGGSFFGTTANSIKFADGLAFSATNPTETPLLTVSVPVGLQMGSNPGAITVQGTGYALVFSSTAPVTQNPSPSELGVQPDKTLALVGGNLNLTGATLNAPQGRVELGSLSGTGLVSLTPISQGYQLSYENGQSFGDIQLTDKSLLTAGALPSVGVLNSGSVQLQGRRIQFSEGSLVLSKHLGDLSAGEILLQASEGIDLIGSTTNAQARSGIASEALNTGTGSSIRIIAPRFTVTQGAAISSSTSGFAPSGGTVQIDAGEVEISGFSAVNPAWVSSLSTSTWGARSAGNLSITSNSLLISEGAAISSATFSAGSSGEVTIRSTNTTIRGANPLGYYSNISAVTLGTGNVQTLTLDTARLQLLNGGAIATTSFFIGQAGNININATESIDIDGRSQINNSSINSAVLHLDPFTRQAFGLPNILSANAGNVNVTTPNLTLTNGGTVSVANQGSGNGGSIQISANGIVLDRQGSIQAQTASGEGGNIALQVGSMSQLRNNSTITATAGGTGNGGNITINSPAIVGLENSDIIANAVQGNGGNIQIDTQGIFGLQDRSQLTPDSDITASSQFGISGTVNVSVLNVNQKNVVEPPPSNFVNTEQAIANSCLARIGNNQGTFAIAGNGELPETTETSTIPYQIVQVAAVQTQPAQLSIHQSPAAASVATPIWKLGDPIVEATELSVNARGQVVLIAKGNFGVGAICLPAGCANAQPHPLLCQPL